MNKQRISWSFFAEKLRNKQFFTSLGILTNFFSSQKVQMYSQKSAKKIRDQVV
jgi:hypothetical protein